MIKDSKDSKRVLCTGSQGFIGSYLCNELLEKGYEVWGIDNYSKYGKSFISLLMIL